MGDAQLDCLIVGGGPAGASAGALLAQAGLSVMLVEKRAFPRFHVGESLIPAANAMLQKIGVWERLHEAGFIRKYGAEFCYGDGETNVHNIFAEGLIPGYEYTFQVERARFDQLLLDRAREAGCAVRQPAELTDLAEADGGWRAQVDGEAVSARFLLDATGRNGLLPRHFGMKAGGFDLPKRFAVYNHFRGVQRKQGREGGNIIIVRVPTGWFWSIPLDDERTSVGLVTTNNRERQRPREVFAANVAENAFMRQWMAGAEPVDEFHVEADYSFRHERLGGKNWLLLGDAAGFIDPVFSSGVYLALESARSAEAMLTGPARQRGSFSEAEIRRYEANLRERMGVMLSLVRLFYDEAGFSVFMRPTERFQLFPAVNAIVAGHTRRDFAVRWRFALFRAVCRLNEKLPLVPRVQL